MIWPSDSSFPPSANVYMAPSFTETSAISLNESGSLLGPSNVYICQCDVRGLDEKQYLFLSLTSAGA